MKHLSKFLGMTAVLAAMAAAPATTQAAVYKTNVLYTCSFGEADVSSSYQQGKSLTLSGETWVASSYRCTSGKFQLGASGSDKYSIAANLQEALAEIDSKAAAANQVFSLVCSPATVTENCTGVSFAWDGSTGGPVQVFLFVDFGNGYQYMGTQEAGQKTAGTISCSFDAQTIGNVALVIRPGAQNSTANGRSVYLTECKILGVPIEIYKMPQPSFSVDNTYPVFPGYQLFINPAEEIEGQKIVYTIDGGSPVTTDAPATVSLTSSGTVKAYSQATNAEDSDPIEATYTVFDINGDFTQWDEKKDYPLGWSADANTAETAITSMNVGNVQDGTKGNCLSLTQTTISNKRLNSDFFYINAGTYTISFDYKFAEGTATGFNIQYQSKSGSSNSYKSIFDSNILPDGASQWETASASLELETDDCIKLAMLLSKSDDGSEWTIYITNLRITSASGNATPITPPSVPSKGKVWGAGSTVCASAEAGQTVAVYDLLGRCLARTISPSDGVVRIANMPCGQILIVKVGAQAAKVVLK